VTGDVDRERKSGSGRESGDGGYGTTRVSRYRKGKTNLDFTEARDREWQWHQLGHMQVCTSLQTTTPAPHHSVFYRLDAHPTNSFKALKARIGEEAYMNK